MASERVQKWLNTTMRDPIVSILLESSVITKIQMETLLIDIIASQIEEKRLTAEEKSRMRITRTEVRRGSYSRTLGQARKNVRKAIFTLLLLGYVGLLETPELQPFIEASSRMKYLADLYVEYSGNDDAEERERIATQIPIVRTEMEELLRDLVRGKRNMG